MGTFSTELSNIVLKTKGRMDTVVRETLVGLGEKLIARSPVGDASYWKNPPPPGYIGGHFKGNWQYGFGAIPVGELSVIDPTGDASRSRIAAGLGKIKDLGGMHYLANCVPYANALENGWSRRQAPRGMVGLTILESKEVVYSAIQVASK